MTWIRDLSDLPVAVGVIVVFTVCLWGILRVIFKRLVDPMSDAIKTNTDSLKRVVENHLEHDREDRAQTREIMKKQAEAFEQLIDELHMRS